MDWTPVSYAYDGSFAGFLTVYLPATPTGRSP